MADANVREWLESAAAHRQAGRLVQAQEMYRQVLRQDADNAEAVAGMGLLARQVGRHPLAAAYFGRAAQVRPDVPVYHQQQAEAWLAAGDFSQAASCFRNAIRLTPSQATLHFNLGIALGKLQRADDAIASLREAVRLDPGMIDAHVELARELEVSGRREEAADVYRQLQALTPDNPNLGFHIAALTGQAPPAAMPASLVGVLFDRHAQTFDEHLTQQLGYRVPELLLNAVNETGVGKELAILDLGCGTGLVGQLFRPRAARLVGVDLSGGMLAKAKQRGVYDELQQRDVLEAMQSAPGSFDLILAGDVLCYLGDLSAVFQAARAALKPGGLFAISVELNDAPGWSLKPARRYAHAFDYVQQTLLAGGFEIVRLQKTALRQDAGKDVNGVIAVARRPAAV
ncbi:MAG TPA: tetratricopeptide repeat protein [Tepidisphaeraceae bacterium]|nr:tetratricopeptide repeat protein [Tepidisphaeraceae bacterium]